ncbi:MAG: S-layer family protein, partial [Actinobacteria bacterium]|nr:S-layer family protein [Actinomycetota bacterium]
MSVENNALFRVAPQVTSTSVIETDPAFTNRRQWLSSAYLLAQLSVDPTTVQKRLGDGFYEQRLVREQVAQLTGRRFLEGYASDEAQYQALLNNAATVATTFQLRPGIALSAEQVNALTSDIVWLVEKDITLPNGEHTRALVPELYAKVRPGDLAANGALLSGRDVTLTTTHNLTNSGQIIAGKSITLAGDNVRNIGGQVSAKTVTIDAANDIDNIGGTLQARDALVLRAARDITVVSTTHTNENANSRRTTLDRVASLTVTGPTAEVTAPGDSTQSDGAGVLVAIAGRNLNLTAAAIVNDAKLKSSNSPYSSNTPNTSNTAATTLIAGNDVNLTIVAEDSANHIVWDRNNQRRDSQRTDVGTQIHTQGDVTITSGHDVNLKAATVHSEQGAVNI